MTPTERPILYTEPMVLALLAGRKTRTRRLVHPQPETTVAYFTRLEDGRFQPHHLTGRRGQHRAGDPIRCPYGLPGDRLWTKEGHALVPRTAYAHDPSIPHRVSPDGDQWAVYRAGWERSRPARWRSSIHLHRWASRLVHELLEVRLERLQRIETAADLGEAEALAEGLVREDDDCGPCYGLPGQMTNRTAYAAYARLWNGINEERGYPYRVNPWVWVLRFRPVEGGAN